MAKKKTTRDQYAEILAGNGIQIKDCEVLVFDFRFDTDPEKFHYAAMLSEPRPEYLIFDCSECRASVVVRKEDVISIELLRRLAAALGWKN